MAASLYSNDSHEQAIAQINITPLVDVMLVLLVIFMLATPVLSAPLPVSLPHPGQEASTPPDRMTLRVDAGGQFALDGQVMSVPQLRTTLQSIAQQAPRTVLEIDAAEDGDYQAFATALDAARGSGLDNIALPR